MIIQPGTTVWFGWVALSTFGIVLGVLAAIFKLTILKDSEEDVVFILLLNFIGLISLIDVVMQVRPVSTMMRDANGWILDDRVAKRRYLMSWFFCDLFILMEIWLMPLVFVDKGFGGNFILMLKAFRLPAIWRAIKAAQHDKIYGPPSVPSDPVAVAAPAPVVQAVAVQVAPGAAVVQATPAVIVGQAAATVAKPVDEDNPNMEIGAPSNPEFNLAREVN